MCPIPKLWECVPRGGLAGAMEIGTPYPSPDRTHVPSPHIEKCLWAIPQEKANYLGLLWVRINIWQIVVMCTDNWLSIRTHPYLRAFGAFKPFRPK